MRNSAYMCKMYSYFVMIQKFQRALLRLIRLNYMASL